MGKKENNRDNFSKSTVELLAKRASYLCSNPDCRKLTVGANMDNNKSTIIGKASHITAASVGGPRFNANLTNEERKHIDNGIWLCSDCATLIDSDKNEYTVDSIIEWKQEAENDSRKRLKGELNPFFTNRYKRQNIDFTLYLKNIVENYNISKLDQLYVNLFGQEDLNTLKIAPIGIELLGEDFVTSFYGNKLSQYVDNDNYNDVETEDEFSVEPNKTRRQPKVDSILNIEQNTQRFIIVGPPGSGKTTTLKKILFQNTNKVSIDNYGIKIPVFIPANEYKKDKNFIQIISEKLGITDCLNLLQDGKLQLLIDGINEIDIEQKHKAHIELSTIINNYSGIAVILTARKTGFLNQFNIPVYELKELQENEIKEFIEKRNPLNKDKIWNQLKENKNLLELAYNPLYLSMIVISSKEGILPNNRGALFDLFVQVLLLREKLSQFEIDSIVDILAELAFYLKNEGIMCIPKEKAEIIICERIKNTYDNHSPRDLLNKVNLCNLISITSNTSFIHEAFLDYFCALKIKIKFNTLFNADVISIQDLGIKNIKELIWYEPIIMCADLFNKREDEIHAQNYFDLFFKGTVTKENNRKPIAKINQNDWNFDLKIPCKIAFNLKNVYPKIYYNAEMYLSNYITLWKLYNSINFEIIPLESLFTGIASLGSIKHFESILFDVNWQEIWLFDSAEDLDDEIIKKDIHELKHFKNLALTLVSNISDFETLCKLLFDDYKLNSVFFPRIKNRIMAIRKTLLTNTSIINIKNTFLNRFSDLDLLNFIAHVDPDFFIANYNMNTWGDIHYINKLTDFVNHENVRIELLKQFKLLNQTLQTRIIKSFLRHNYLQIFDHIKMIVNETGLSDKNFKIIKNELKYLTLDSIPPILQDYFFKHNITFSASYEIIKCIKEISSVSVRLSHISNYEFLKKNMTICFDNKYYGEIKSINYLIKKLIENAASVFEIKKKSEKHFQIDYSNIEKYEITLLVKILTVANLDYISKNGKIQGFLSAQDFDDLHPEKLDYYLTHYPNLTHSELSETQVKTLVQYGLVHKYHKLIPDVNYGIILSQYNLSVRVYSLLHNTFSDLSVSQQEIDIYKVNQIVIIEANKKIGYINEEDQNDPKVGYLTNEIIRIDYDKREGHIRKSKKEFPEEKDFYFHFDDCDFPPNLGDSVSFIPSINIFPSSFGLPKAYNIRITSYVKRCKIIMLKYDGQTMDLYGVATDNENFKELNFIIRKTNRLKIINLKCNDIFSYRILSYPTSDNRAFIKLLEKIPYCELNL